MAKKIMYEQKVGIQNDEEIPNINKVTDNDLNEIKSVVNENADELEQIQKEQISQNTQIEKINQRNTEQENKLTEIEQEQANQDDKINTNEANILNLQEVETLQNKTIEELQQENIEQSKTIETLKEEKAELEKNLDSVLISANSSGEYVHLNDSAEYPCSISLFGNDKQDGEVSLDNAVEIQAVGNNVNLIDIKEFNLTGGTTTHQGKNFYYDLKAGTYTVQRKFEKSSNASNGAGMVQIYVDGIFLKNLEPLIANTTFTLEKDSNISFQFKLSTSLVSETESSIRFYDIKLEKGTIATEYSPYRTRLRKSYKM